jgi:hypothetical protein
MAITKDPGRQEVTAAYVEFDHADLTSGTRTPLIDIPAGAIVLGGFVGITEAFNSGTTDALIVGDAVDADEYATVAAGSGALSLALYKALTPTGYQYTTNDAIELTWTGAGTAASAGAGYMIVYYIVEGRAESSFTK